MMLSLLALFSTVHSAYSEDCNFEDMTQQTCDGFVPSDSSITPLDACTLTSDSKRIPCGRSDITLEDCTKAGCCLDKNGACFEPLRPNNREFQYHNSSLNYKQAKSQCSKYGEGYQLPCVKSASEYAVVRERSCGQVWLRGVQHTTSQVNAEIPFYNKTSENCEENVSVSCPFSPGRGSDRFVLLPQQEDFFLAMLDKSEKNPFLCIRDTWRPHLYNYPEHKESEEGVMCGLKILGKSAKDSDLRNQWKVTHPNGTTDTISSKRYSINVGTGRYITYTKTDWVGKYSCVFSYDGADGGREEVIGWSYRFTSINCSVAIGDLTGAYSNVEHIAHQAEYGQSVDIHIWCTGFPEPSVIVHAREPGKIATNYHETQLSNYGESYVQSTTFQNFASQVPIDEDYSLEVIFEPKSAVPAAMTKNTTITLTKLPIPSKCTYKIYHDNTEEDPTTLSSSEEEIGVKPGASISILIQCMGYPAATINGTMARAVAGRGWTSEVLQSNISSVLWQFKEFSNEANLEDSFTMRLDISAGSLEEPPLLATILLVKLPITTTCNLYLKMQDTEETLKLENLSETVEKESLAHQNITMRISCTGFPLPRLQVRQVVEKPGAEDEEGNTQEFPGTEAEIRVEDFANQASAAGDYKLRLITTAQFLGRDLIDIAVVMKKIFIKFSVELPMSNYVIGKPAVGEDSEGSLEPSTQNQIRLPCKGEGAGPFKKTSSYWRYNGATLDIHGPLGEFVHYGDEKHTELIINGVSSLVTGIYTCVIDNSYNTTYSTVITTQLPPVAPGPTSVRLIEDGQVYARSYKSPSYEYSQSPIEFTGYMYVAGSDDAVETMGVVTAPYDNYIEAAFPAPKAGGIVQYSFAARNEFGKSGLSVRSEELVVLPDTTISSVEWIKRLKKSGIPLYSALSLTFSEIPNVDKYQVRVYDESSNIIRLLFKRKSATMNEIIIEDLQPESLYFVDVRGMIRVDAKEIYGPASLKISFKTSSTVLPSPSGLTGTTLEGEDGTAAVLLTWDAPVGGEGFIEGYILEYSPVLDLGTRKKRQALQTVKTVFIPFGSKASIIKGLDSGTTYEFILKSFSADFGESEPAVVTLETLTVGPCPYSTNELYHPTSCKPRVSIDGMWLFLKYKFYCFEGIGDTYEGEFNTAINGEQCALWSKNKLKTFPRNSNITPPVGSNYCRNPSGSMRDAETLHTRPWCFLEDGRNMSCAIRPCNTDTNVECYTEAGYAFQGTGFNDGCAEWKRETLEQANITFPEKILGSRLCRNWEGTAMSRPWCFNKQGAKSECDIHPCGHATVRIGNSNATRQIKAVHRENSLCVKLDEIKRRAPDGTLLGTHPVSVQQNFGVENCNSRINSVQVPLPDTIGLTDRLWFRYLLVELGLLVLLVVLWNLLFCRKRLIDEQQSSGSAGTSRQPGTSTLLLSYSSRTNSSQFS